MIAVERIPLSLQTKVCCDRAEPFDYFLRLHLDDLALQFVSGAEGVSGIGAVDGITSCTGEKHAKLVTFRDRSGTIWVFNFIH